MVDGWLLPSFRPCLVAVQPTIRHQLLTLKKTRPENRIELFFAPRVGKDVSNLFLDQIGQSDPEALHLVVWDQAGFHPKDGEMGVPSNVRLLPLPAYSPELNPVEALGDLVKDAIANKLFGCLDSLQEAILKELQPLRVEAQRVRSLLGNHSIVASANNSVPI